MRYRALSALSLLVGLLPAAAVAQAPAPLSDFRGAAGAALETYGFGRTSPSGIERMSLYTVPIGARARLFGSSSIEVSGAYARGTVKRVDGSTLELAGFTDTQITVALPVRPDVATIAAVALLPTGTSRMTEEEAVVAGVLASELLPFRISNWGTGGAVGMSAALAQRFGAIGLGASASYLVGREYDLMEVGSYAYRPGNQLRARMAMDVAAGTRGKASFQLTYLHSGEDRLSGANVFRPGDRVQGMASYAFAAGRGASGIAYGGFVHRARGAYLVSLAEEPGTVNLFLAGGGLRIVTGRAALVPAFDMRLLRRSDGRSEGEVLGVGSSAELPLRHGVTLVPSVRVRLGQLQLGTSSSSGFTGADVGFGVRFGAGQP